MQIVVVFFILITGNSCLQLGSGKSRGRTWKGQREINPNKTDLNIGLIVPHSIFGKKSYIQKIGESVTQIKKKNYAWESEYTLTEANVDWRMMKVNPSPQGKSSPYSSKYLDTA